MPVACWAHCDHLSVHPLGESVLGGRQKVDIALDLLRDFTSRKEGRPGSRQLDAQRHALHQLANSADVEAVLVGEGEAWRGALRGQDEQLLGAVLGRGQVARAHRFGRSRGYGQAAQLQRKFAGHVEGLAGGN
jgi:hypothetical protein